ncbi:MAG: nucleoside deaminase [Gemmatimonadales bacterium]
MRRALEIAELNVSSGRGGPFGAVIVRGGEIVGEGCNTVTSGNDPTAHAEIMAIRAACGKLGDFSLSGCEIYTNCEPCPMCLAAIYWARLDRIYYANSRSDAAAIGFDDEFLYDEVALPESERKIPAERLDIEGARDAFNAWRDKPDKIPY